MIYSYQDNGSNFYIATVSGEAISTPTGVSVEWSPDGLSFILDNYDRQQISDADISITQISDLKIVEGISLEGYSIYKPLWSPDGRFVAYLQKQNGSIDGQTMLWSPLEGSFPLPYGNNNSPVVWSPDGTKLITFEMGGLLHIVPLDGSSPKTIGISECADWQPIYPKPLVVGNLIPDGSQLVASCQRNVDIYFIMELMGEASFIEKFADALLEEVVGIPAFQVIGMIEPVIKGKPDAVTWNYWVFEGRYIFDIVITDNPTTRHYVSYTTQNQVYDAVGVGVEGDGCDRYMPIFRLD